MGTKNRPGPFDCHAKAHPDEPMFVLLGRDPMAPALVREWARRRREAGESEEKVCEALACADAMEEWKKRLDDEKAYVARTAETIEELA